MTTSTKQSIAIVSLLVLLLGIVAAYIYYGMERAKEVNTEMAVPPTEVTPEDASAARAAQMEALMAEEAANAAPSTPESRAAQMEALMAEEAANNESAPASTPESRQAAIEAAMQESVVVDESSINTEPPAPRETPADPDASLPTPTAE